MDANLVIKNNLKMFWYTFLEQLGVAKFEKMLLFVMGLSLTQIHTLVGIMVALAAGCVTVYFAVRKHRKREQRDHEKHILDVMKDLADMGRFEEGMPFEERKRITIEYIDSV